MLKDIVDISGLLRVLDGYKEKGARPLNYDLVKQYLKEADKEHCLHTLDTIMTEIIKS